MPWLKKLFTKTPSQQPDTEIDDTYHTHVAEMSDEVIRSLCVAIASYNKKDEVNIQPLHVIISAKQLEDYIKTGQIQ